jgi:hypothetical protein
MPYYPPAGSGGAPANATYITQTADGTLTNEQALSALSTGIMKVTTATGVVSSLADPLPSTNGGMGVSNAGTLTNASNTTITGGGTLTLGGFNLTVPATGTAALLATANVFTAAQSIAVNDAVTNTTTTLATLTHNSSGTPAASFGSRLLFNLDSATVDDRNAAAIDVVWTTATDASRTSNILFSIVNSAAALATGMTIAPSAISISASDSTAGTPVRFSSTNTNSAGQAGFLATNNGGATGQMSVYGSAHALTDLRNNMFFGSSNSPIIGSNSGSQNGGSNNVLFYSGGYDGATQQVMALAPPGSSVNTVVDGILIDRTITGTPAAGYGTRTATRLKSSTTANTLASNVETSWVVATHASRTARAVYNIYDTAAREALRLEASGTAAMIGFLGANASARQIGGENVTNNVTSGGTDGTIANYTDLTIYTNDAAAIRNNIYQLARLVKQNHDALRLYGLLT